MDRDRDRDRGDDGKEKKLSRSIDERGVEGDRPHTHTNNPNTDTHTRPLHHVAESLSWIEAGSAIILSSFLFQVKEMR